MNLLFVCAGNSCRLPMAMAIAQKAFGGLHTCDSAAGKIKNGAFKSGKLVSSGAVTAVAKVGCSLVGYQPKPLSSTLVEWADWVLFLGEEFKTNALRAFPESRSKFSIYGCYTSRIDGKEMVDIPDPFDGDHWKHYFSEPWPGRKPASYAAVAVAMRDDFQKKLNLRLNLG